MIAKQKSEAAPVGAAVRVSLSYCPRCGRLRVCPAEETQRVCLECLRFLMWIYGGKRSAAGAQALRYAARPLAAGGRA
jgi:hypothetical protein